MALYEISQNYRDFITAVEAGEIPEEAIADTLEGIQGEFNQKADNIACLIKNLTAECEAIKAEESALKERRDSKSRKVVQLKRYLAEAMQQMGIKKLETARNALSFRKSASVIIADEKGFYQKYPELCKTETVITIPKAEISKLIKAGQDISGAELRVNQNLQIK